MIGILGKKIGMTTYFEETGDAVPCTVIEAGPCVITQIKTKDKDGYEAVQFGFGIKKEKNVTESFPLIYRSVYNKFPFHFLSL